ncbi:hypothetical protein [uncultured Tateyamaria sp.]|uniref:hypothetical protein n=1 Tax=uncultured Tateyamaria sp. TaxID=455651 RepID=UPI002637CD91|nr:hypothetical protein [uncultured Tateyamaria sp.]
MKRFVSFFALQVRDNPTPFAFVIDPFAMAAVQFRRAYWRDDEFKDFDLEALDMKLVHIFMVALVLAGVGLNAERSMADTTETLKRLYSEGAFLVGGTAAEVSGIQPPPFSIADAFEADVAYDQMYIKPNGFPQANVVNFYLLWPDHLAALGLEGLDNCIAQKEGEYRYIFCNGPSLLQATQAFDLALEPEGPASFALARLILGHELIHHILRHTDRFEEKRPTRAELRVIEREADLATAQMFAERFQRERLYAKFFPPGSDLAEQSDSMMPDWLLQLFQVGSTHDDWDTRLRSHVVRSTEVFIDAKAYRGLEPAQIVLPEPSCTDQSSCAFAQDAMTTTQLVDHWFRSPFDDRKAIAKTIIEIGSERGLAKAGSYQEMAMLCQAYVLEGQAEQCAPVFDVYEESAMGVFNYVSDDDRVFGLQTMIMRRPDTEADAAALVQNFANYAIEPLYVAWYSHKPMGLSPVYSYLSFLRGENNTVDCGTVGEGFRPEEYYDCGTFAREVQAQLANNPFSPVALMNIAQMLKMDNPEHQISFVTLAALALTQPTRGVPMPGWLDLLANVPPDLLATGDHDYLFPMPQILFQIGMTSMAVPHFEHLNRVLPKIIPNEQGLSQAWLEMGADCLDVYMASCAIEHFKRSERIYRALTESDDPKSVKHANAMLGTVNFRLARAYIILEDAASAVPLLEEELATEDRVAGRIGILETIAEAHLMDCNGPEADAALRRAEALFDSDPERDEQRHAMSAGYRNSINYLLGDKAALAESRKAVDAAYEAWIGLTPSGFDPMIGMCNGYRRFNSLVLD